MRTLKLLIFLILIFQVSQTAFAQPRKVLVEQFTNSGCPPCAAYTPIVASFVNAHSDSILMIAYHTAFPYTDSMYHENPSQSNNRVAYYNIVGVPRSVVDGNYFNGNLLATLSTTLLTRAAIPPRYEVSFISSTLNNSQVDLNISLVSTDPNNQSEQLVAHMVLVEKNVLKSSYVCCAGANTETEYPWVMRKMLPDENGTILVNKQVGGTDMLTLSVNAINFKDFAELRVIVFVQNNVTKEVYQAEISQPTNITSLADLQSEFENDYYFTNPLSGNRLDIIFKTDSKNRAIAIYDGRGRVVYKGISDQEKHKVINLDSIESGIYFIEINNSGIRSIKKLIVQ